MAHFELATAIESHPDGNDIRCVAINMEPDKYPSILNALHADPSVTVDLRPNSVEVIFGLDDAKTPRRKLQGRVAAVIEEAGNHTISRVKGVVALNGLKSVFEHLEDTRNQRVSVSA